MHGLYRLSGQALSSPNKNEGLKAFYNALASQTVPAAQNKKEEPP
jgi:hypothetical protein